MTFVGTALAVRHAEPLTWPILADLWNAVERPKRCWRADSMRMAYARAVAHYMQGPGCSVTGWLLFCGTILYPLRDSHRVWEERVKQAWGRTSAFLIDLAQATGPRPVRWLAKLSPDERQRFGRVLQLVIEYTGAVVAEPRDARQRDALCRQEKQHHAFCSVACREAAKKARRRRSSRPQG